MLSSRFVAKIFRYRFLSKNSKKESKHINGSSMEIENFVERLHTVSLVKVMTWARSQLPIH